MFLVQVIIEGLMAGTQYIVTVEAVLKGDRPGPKTTLVISTTGKLGMHAMYISSCKNLKLVIILFLSFKL